MNTKFEKRLTAYTWYIHNFIKYALPIAVVMFVASLFTNKSNPVFIMLNFMGLPLYGVVSYSNSENKSNWEVNIKDFESIKDKVPDNFQISSKAKRKIILETLLVSIVGAAAFFVCAKDIVEANHAGTGDLIPEVTLTINIILFLVFALIWIYLIIMRKYKHYLDAVYFELDH